MRGGDDKPLFDVAIIVRGLRNACAWRTSQIDDPLWMHPDLFIQGVARTHCTHACQSSTIKYYLHKRQRIMTFNSILAVMASQQTQTCTYYYCALLVLQLCETQLLITPFNRCLSRCNTLARALLNTLI